MIAEADFCHKNNHLEYISLILEEVVNAQLLQRTLFKKTTFIIESVFGGSESMRFCMDLIEHAKDSVIESAIPFQV